MKKTRKPKAISKPGLYPDLPVDVYDRDPCAQPSLRSSVAALLVDRTPAHAYAAHPRLNKNFREKKARHFDLGSVAHRVLLGAGRDVRIIRADNFQGGAAKIARDMAHAHGQIPILQTDHDSVMQMVESARQQIANHADWSAAFVQGTPEASLIWVESFAPKQKIYCRVRLDWLPHDWKTNSLACYPDFKTVGQRADDAWEFSFWREGLDFRHAFYRRGIQKALGVTYKPRVVYCVQETDQPHALMFHEPDDETQKGADEQVEFAMRLYAQCLAANNWPGYPNGTNYIQMRGFARDRWESYRDFIGDKPTAESLHRLTQMFSPL